MPFISLTLPIGLLNQFNKLRRHKSSVEFSATFTSLIFGKNYTRTKPKLDDYNLALLLIIPIGGRASLTVPKRYLQ
jgi:hypothetical protein